jgi:hypothetical protein
MFCDVEHRAEKNAKVRLFLRKCTLRQRPIRDNDRKAWSCTGYFVDYTGVLRKDTNIMINHFGTRILHSKYRGKTVLNLLLDDTNGRMLFVLSNHVIFKVDFASLMTTNLYTVKEDDVLNFTGSPDFFIRNNGDLIQYETIDGKRTVDIVKIYSIKC